MNPSPPRLLLVEDDPVSASFLADAAATLPAQVEVAAGIADGYALAIAGQPHQLYLVDANLVDGRGETLLLRLRERGLAAPALAHTAAHDARVRTRLLEAGFVEVLGKPMAMAALHAALRRHLGPPAGEGCRRPHWDDASALAALGGELTHVAAMRDLFRAELPAQRQRIEAAAIAGDAGAIRAELHRLLASCGFVGASRLAEAVRGFQAAPLEPAALQRFRDAADALVG